MKRAKASLAALTLSLAAGLRAQNVVETPVVPVIPAVWALQAGAGAILTSPTGDGLTGGALQLPVRTLTLVLTRSVLDPDRTIIAPVVKPVLATPARWNVAGALETVQNLNEALAQPDAPPQPQTLLKVYDAGRHAPGAVVLAVPAVVNDEGIQIVDREVARYYREIRRLVEALKSKGLDLSESLDVMDDSYAEIWAKLKTIERIAKDRNVADVNTHLAQTLFWVDATLKDNGRTTAIHTNRVYFHHAENPESEISEGKRRTDQYLREALENLKRSGKAEQVLGPIDEVILAFDTRGYDEIKRYLKQEEAALAKAHGDRYRFVYLDELTAIPSTPDAVRRELNGMIGRYQKSGLEKINDGVTYSRYVGLLLELKTLERFVNGGYKILQSGRDLFDADGIYITELDAVVQSPQDGAISIVEAKSARVQIPLEQVLKDKVLYKLDAYKKHGALIKSSIGIAPETPLDVIFAFDVGPNAALKPFLTNQEQALSSQYGLKVRFMFLESMPRQEPPDRPRLKSKGHRSSRAPPPPRIAGRPAPDEKLPPGAKSVTAYRASAPEDIDALIPVRRNTKNLIPKLKEAILSYGELRILVYDDGVGGKFIGLDLLQEPGWLDHIPRLEEHEKVLIRKIFARTPDVKVVVTEDGMTPDLIVGGVVTELKTHNSLSGDDSLAKQIDKANRQVIAFGGRHRLGGGHLAIDLLWDEKVPVEKMTRSINAWARAARPEPALARIWVYSQGDVRSFALQSDGSYRLRDQSLEEDPLNRPMDAARIRGLTQEGFRVLTTPGGTPPKSRRSSPRRSR